MVAYLLMEVNVQSSYDLDLGLLSLFHIWTLDIIFALPRGQAATGSMMVTAICHIALEFSSIVADFAIVVDDVERQALFVIVVVADI